MDHPVLEALRASDANVEVAHVAAALVDGHDGHLVGALVYELRFARVEVNVILLSRAQGLYGLYQLVHLSFKFFNLIN